MAPLKGGNLKLPVFGDFLKMLKVTNSSKGHRELSFFHVMK